MSRPPEDPNTSTLIAFHEFAAARGDGLDPRLAAALARTGKVSGPPARPEDPADNVIQVSFATAVRETGKARSQSA